MSNIFLFRRLKSLFILACLLSLSVFVASCDEDDPPRVSLSNTELIFGYEAATQSINVESNSAWSARIEPADAKSWCRLSLENSDRPETVKVYVDANLPQGTVTKERHATVVFTIGGSGKNTSTTLHVTQGIKPELD